MSLVETTTRTEQPVNTPTIPASVGVPLLRALVFLALDGIAASAVAATLKKAALPVVTAGVGDWMVQAVVNAVHPLSIGAIIGVMSARFHWQRELSEANAALWRIEEITRTDLDGDGHVGAPPVPAPRRPDHPLTLVFGAPPHKTRQERFEAFVRGCKDSTAQNYWEGPPHNLPREDYINWRDTLIRLGWAAWRSGSSKKPGWELLFTPEEIIAQGLRRAGRVEKGEL